MSSFTVRGGNRLSGYVSVSGSKNAALPIIFATLLTRGVNEIRHLPHIRDTAVALSLIEDFGASVHRLADSVIIDTKDIVYRTPCREKTAKIRASTYLMGACLCAFGRVELCEFGGCNFSLRPIDLHISAARDFGAEYDEGADALYGRLHSAHIRLAKQSVGATVNSLLMASATDGESRIYNYACEPHILALVAFLESAGARITLSDECITVLGGRLCGGAAEIPGDMIEAGTYLTASLLTDGDVRVGGLDVTELDSFITPLAMSGICAELYGDGSVSLFGRAEREIYVRTAAYPAFPTDLQPIVAPLMGASMGGRIEETVWLDRFGYLDGLAAFGIDSVRSGCSARIYPSHIRSGISRAPDLRGGAAMLVSALCARGESRIDSAETVLRGYENITEKLTSLGAEIICSE